MPACARARTLRLTPDTTVTAAYVYSKLDDATLPEGSVSHDIEKSTYSWSATADMPNTPWVDKYKYIKNASIVDNGIKPKSTSLWFAPFINLTSVTGLDKLNTNTLTDTSYMFEYCTKLEEVDLRDWNASSLVNMGSMFSECQNLKKIIFPQDMNTSNVQYMDYLFNECYFLQSLDLSAFDTSSVTTMNHMFEGCWRIPASVFAQTKNFNTSNVTDMSAMFMDCGNMSEGAVLDISGWDTSSALYMSDMFSSSSNLTVDCSKWDVSKLDDHYAFNTGAGKVTQPTWS